MNIMPRISVILVNYNDGPNLQVCLDSLVKNSGVDPLEILVVDNASTDGSLSEISTRFPEVRLIRNTQNEGYGKANNQGLAQSRGEAILFLNTDTKITPGSLGILLDALGSDPRVGAVGPALIHRDGCAQVSFGRKVDFFHELFQKSFFNPYYRRRMRTDRTPKDTGWLSGACLLCRRLALDAVGGFDEDFFLYFEDIDLCERLRKAGWRLVHVPRARIDHQGGATTLPRALFSRYHYRKSQLYYYAKHNSRISNFFLRVYLLKVFCLRFLLEVFKPGGDRVGRWRFFRLLKP